MEQFNKNVPVVRAVLDAGVLVVVESPVDTTLMVEMDRSQC